MSDPQMATTCKIRTKITGISEIFSDFIGSGDCGSVVTLTTVLMSTDAATLGLNSDISSTGVIVISYGLQVSILYTIMMVSITPPMTRFRNIIACGGDELFDLCNPYTDVHCLKTNGVKNSND